MPRGRRVRIGIELAPTVAQEAQSLVDAGHWLSIQEFCREAIKEKIERWKKEHPLGLPPPQRER